MKRLIATAALTFVLAGPAAAETRPLSGFRAIDAEDRLTVTVVIGDAYVVEVSGADAQRVRTRVDGRTLYIEDSRRPWFGGSPRLDAHVRVTSPAIDGVAASRGAHLDANLAGGGCDDFSAAASMGASTIVAGLHCNAVSSSASMGGDVRLAGECGAHAVSASMGAFVRADELQCDVVTASASMGGDIRANARQSYQARASMGGTIDVFGGATARQIATSMGGSVSAR
jgi:hypothetical protein